MTKGTSSFGKRHNKTHTLCRRCGRRSYQCGGRKKMLSPWSWCWDKSSLLPSGHFYHRMKGTELTVSGRQKISISWAFEMDQVQKGTNMNEFPSLFMTGQYTVLWQSRY
ncbi:hypothetical protein BJY00DRAFT_98189 [Aspergillus carlsbadensis]|nr:hypothetical protein BJY00DRAFT_98189 [Aspergillus carlsbadensis]